MCPEEFKTCSLVALDTGVTRQKLIELEHLARKATTTDRLKMHNQERDRSKEIKVPKTQDWKHIDQIAGMEYFGQCK